MLSLLFFFFFNDTATTEIYTLSLHDALPISVVLESRVREKVLARTRGILRSNYPVIEEWLKRFGDTFSWHPPQAGAICLVRYRQAIGALDLVEKMRAEHSVLLVPGDHFGVPHPIRFGFGGGLHPCPRALG